MRMPKNVVCLELAFDQEIEPEHLFNMDIISKNLDDFNVRFNMDIMLTYDIYDYAFTPFEENNEHAVWFCEGINELLAFAYSPINNEIEDLHFYLENRKKEIKYLNNPQLYDSYAKRYHDYAPIGFLTAENMDYIKYEMNNLLFS